MCVLPIHDALRRGCENTVSIAYHDHTVALRRLFLLTCFYAIRTFRIPSFPALFPALDHDRFSASLE